MPVRCDPRSSFPAVLKRRILAAAAALFLAFAVPAAGDRLTAAEAERHVGEWATVCGEVASTRYERSSSGHPTLLDLDRPDPGQIFTVVISEETRRQLDPPPERRYRSSRICVTGEISTDHGVPQIVVEKPQQIEIVREPASLFSPSPAARPSSRPPQRRCVPRAQCCKVCSKGAACGDSCISRSYTCHKGRGCACNAAEVC